MELSTKEWHTPGNHMLPDAAGTLEVLADCERHYTRQLKADLWLGKTAPCPQRVQPCRGGVR